MASRGQPGSMGPSTIRSTARNTVPSISNRTSRSTIARTTRTLARRRRSSAPDASRQDRGRKMSQDKQAERRAGHALDAANNYLTDEHNDHRPNHTNNQHTEQKRDKATIGVVMSVATIAGILAQT